ncbi:unnamed protein product [Caenorhabditis bovis]|uniref:Cyclin N-terminal domain-containing protein n=1 Tax=Caenorhabditis bovis TaxID=2654633 RepID=A0A8S1EZL1_9PELO|nr:unnamed protein product [Caenorhabditis bovis]
MIRSRMNQTVNRKQDVAKNADYAKPSLRTFGTTLMKENAAEPTLISKQSAGEVVKEIPRAVTDKEVKCLEYFKDICAYLLHHEQKFKLTEDYLVGGEPTNKMRRMLVDWLVQVHLRFRLVPETLHLTVFILDQMLAHKIVGKENLQLLGVSAMFIAAKFEEVFTPDISDYEFITENSVSKKQILQMEQMILNTLNFDLSAPYSLSFNRFISRLITENESLNVDQSSYYLAYNMSKYFAELALLDSSIVTITPSRIAMASTVISLKLCGFSKEIDEQVTREIIKGFQTTHDELEYCVKLVSSIALKQFSQTKMVAVKQKYQSSKFGQVSNMIKAEEIEKLKELSA